MRRLIKRHQMGDCCCFCVRTKLGATIIGVGLILSLAAEYACPNLVRVLIKLAPVVAFVLMMLQDCASYRQLYLYTFSMAMPLIAAVNLIAYQNIIVDNVVFAEQFCGLSQLFKKEQHDDRMLQDCLRVLEEDDEGSHPC